MDVIVGLVVLLVGAFVLAIVRHDAPHWTIGCGRRAVRTAASLQATTDREFAAAEAEYDALAVQIIDGRAPLSSAMRFAFALLAGQLWWTAVRAGRRALAVVSRPVPGLMLALASPFLLQVAPGSAPLVVRLGLPFVLGLFVGRNQEPDGLTIKVLGLFSRMRGR